MVCFGPAITEENSLVAKENPTPVCIPRSTSPSRRRRRRGGAFLCLIVWVALAIIEWI